MSKICFCDFDGNINSAQYFHKLSGGGLTIITHESEMLDPVACSRLNEILTKTGAEIVVSSTWRAKGVEKLKQLFINRGFPSIAARIIDVTEQSGETRGRQIKKWLDGKDVRAYCILEDDPDSDMNVENLVQTNYETGLLPEHVERAVRILNK